MDTAEITARFKADQYAVGLTGIEIVDINDNCVKTKLLVEPKHLNSFGTVQGGALFTLADYTFAVAINIDPKASAVAIECHISFLKPTTTGILYAESKIISKSRSLIACDVIITNEQGAIVAKFHGRGFFRQ